MTARALLPFFAVLVATALPATYAVRRLAVARAGAKGAQTLLLSTSRDAQELVDLRARRERVALGERPKQDVLAMLTGVLNDAGIPSARLKDLSQESDAAIATVGTAAAANNGPIYRRQTLAITLEPLGVAELGRALAALRAKQRVWTPVRIELSRSLGNGIKDTDGLYSIRMALAATYVAEPRSTSAATGGPVRPHTPATTAGKDAPP
jgi:hypothetical protein